jgi:hypothetical protein
MRHAARFTAVTIAITLTSGCLPEDVQKDGWNNLGRSCGNGYHADFSFTIEGGESFQFNPSPGETTDAAYGSETGQGTTELTQFIYEWEKDDDEVNATFGVRSRLTTGSTEVTSFDEGAISITVIRGGQLLYSMGSNAFSLEVDELGYGGITAPGTTFERVHHAEGSFSGSFFLIQGIEMDTVNVSGTFCLHGYEE